MKLLLHIISFAIFMVATSLTVQADCSPYVFNGNDIWMEVGQFGFSMDSNDMNYRYSTTKSFQGQDVQFSLAFIDGGANIQSKAVNPKEIQKWSQFKFELFKNIGNKNEEYWLNSDSNCNLYSPRDPGLEGLKLVKVYWRARS